MLTDQEIVHNKLVRDHIPEIIVAQGKTPITRTLSAEEYLRCLDEKLREEVAEYEASRSRDEAVLELADVLEVFHAILAARGISLDEVEEAREKKRTLNGGFKQRIFLERVFTNSPRS